MEWQAERVGECDGCHREAVAVCELADEPGEWEYCRECWSRVVRGKDQEWADELWRELQGWGS